MKSLHWPLSSPQELFYQTIEAFNLSETYRVPVLIMTDEMIGHLSERVVIPKAKAIHTVSRPRARGRKDRFKPFKPGPNGVAPMAIAGEGYRVHITGLTHDERGYPDMTVEGQEAMMDRIVGKIRNNLEHIIKTEEYRLDDAEIVIVSYGVSSRTSLAAVEAAREQGIKVGLLRLITVWPFPEEQIRNLAARVKGFITVEINLGQIHLEVERSARGQAPCLLGRPCRGNHHYPRTCFGSVKKVSNRYSMIPQ